MAVLGAKKKILITVRTYPVPATRGVEVSCTAGVTHEGEWIRLFPLPYRSLDEDKQFRKYEWIEAEVRKATNDQRPESFIPNLETIRIIEKLSTSDGWRTRKNIIKPLLRPSMCSIQQQHAQQNAPTLGVFKPGKIKRLVIEPEESAVWTPSELAKLNQTLSLFQKAPETQLEKIPFKFKYEFLCNDSNCNGHSMSCMDLELGQSYRKWRADYGDQWQSAIRERYESQMIEKFDTHFFVGNLHQFPQSWIIVGLFYPPQQSTGDLFDLLT